jgi:hypothetical protein
MKRETLETIVGLVGLSVCLFNLACFVGLAWLIAYLIGSPAVQAMLGY